MKQSLSLLTILFIFYNSSYAQLFTELTFVDLEGIREGASEMADVNGDGYQDILIIGFNASTASVANLYLNDGNLNFTLNTSSEIEGIHRGDIVFGDLDNDGDNDLIAAGIPSNFSRMCRLYTNDGNGNFPLPAEDGFDPAQDCKLALSDIDNDQDLDMLITGRTPGFAIHTVLYRNEGSGQFSEIDPNGLTSVYSGRQVFSDVDMDGDNDLIISGLTNTWSYTNLYINDGQGGFTDMSGDVPFTRTYYNSVEMGDVDNDGDEDLFLADNNSTKIYLNDGTGSFTELLGTPFVRIGAGYARFGDFDGDDDLDIIMTGKDQGTFVAKAYLNNANGTFTEVLDSPFEGTVLGDISLGDIDNDGDLDVLIVGEDEDNKAIAKLYRNDFIVNTSELQENNKCNLSITPNPTTNGVLTANLNCNLGSNAMVTILDSNGKYVFRNLKNRESNQTSMRIDVSGLRPGIYVLQVENYKDIIAEQFFIGQ